MDIREELRERHGDDLLTVLLLAFVVASIQEGLLTLFRK
jgi:hypothetical protein